MAYYNYGYPQYYPQAPTASQAPAMPGQQGGGIIWVQGEAGAKSYMVAPNTTVQLWDSEAFQSTGPLRDPTAILHIIDILIIDFIVHYCLYYYSMIPYLPKSSKNNVLF